MFTRSMAATIGCAIAALVIAGPAWATVRYSVTDLGTLGGDTSEAFAINASGQAVGIAANTGNTSRSAVLFGSPNIDINGGFPGSALGINSGGQIVGYSEIGGGFQGFIYSPATIDSPATLTDLRSGLAIAINDSGQVAGDPYGGGTAAFLYTPETPSNPATMVDLGLGGSGGTFVAGLNNIGQVVGQSYIADNTAPHAFLYTPATDTAAAMINDLGTLGGNESEAMAINDSGQIIGVSETADDSSHLFFYDGTMHDLGITSPVTTGTLDHFAINQSGDAVGYFNPNGVVGGEIHAFLYQNSSVFDLNDLIDPLSGWTLEQATGINDSGQIVGWGYDSNGERAFLLTPIPEPASMALLGAGSLLLLRRRRLA